MAPGAGDRFLDLACGTGGVALIAAWTGAEVTGLDIAADQLAKARAAAAEAGLSIRFDEGDVQQLPYEDASFDVLASAFGLIFAPSDERTAAELVRVCRPGGRLAITAWPHDAWSDLAAALGREPPPGDDARAWAREDYVRSLLGDAFELRFEQGTWVVQAESPAALWELLSTSVPPLRLWLAELEPVRRAEVDAAYLEFLGSGTVHRNYVLTLGVRR